MGNLKTDHLGTWLKRAGFMYGMRPHRAYLTSKDWAELAAEIEALNLASDTPIINQPTNKNFQAIRIADGALTLVNSGTEDQATCNMLNLWDLGEEDRRLMEFRATQLFPVQRLDKPEVKD